MDVRGEHAKADAPPQRVRRVILRKRLDEDEQRADSIVAGQQRGQDPAQPPSRTRAEDCAALLEAGGDAQHGVFQHGHEERKDVQAHDQHQIAEAEESLRPSAREREKLLEQTALLHEQNPAHRGDVRRRHEGNHEHDVKPFVAGELRAGEQERRRQRDHAGEQHDAQAKQERIEDGAHVPGIGYRRKGPIQVKAAIRDDRPGKYLHAVRPFQLENALRVFLRPRLRFPGAQLAAVKAEPLQPFKALPHLRERREVNERSDSHDAPPHMPYFSGAQQARRVFADFIIRQNARKSNRAGVRYRAVMCTKS